MRAAPKRPWIVAVAVVGIACAGGTGGTHGGAAEIGDPDGSGTNDGGGTTGSASHPGSGDTMPDASEPPATPLMVAAEPGATEIAVSWTPGAAGGTAEGFVVLLDETEVESVPATASMTTLTGLQPATAHVVSVVAENAAGSSAPSEGLRVVTDFHPTAFPGTRLWLDADDAATFTLFDTDRVSQWEDKSGQSNHAYQGIDDLMPTRVAGVQNGRTTVRFDDTYLTTSNVVQLRDTDAGYTVFAVVMNTKADGIEGNEGRGGVLLGNFGDDTPNVSVELHHDRQLRHWWDARDEPGLPTTGNTGDARFPSPTPAQNAWAIVHFYRDGAAGKFGGGVDGLLAAEIDDEGPNLTVSLPFRVGGDYRASPLSVSWNGDIAELMVFDRLLTPDERARLHDQLSFKWAIPVD